MTEILGQIFGRTISSVFATYLVRIIDKILHKNNRQ